MSNFAERLIAGQVEAAINSIVTATVRYQFPRIARDFTDGVVSAYKGGTIGPTNGVKALAIGFQKNFASPKDLEAVNSKVAKMMRTSVRRSFGAQFRGGPGHYRVGAGPTTKGGFLSRYSGGALRRAVYNDQLAVGDADGIRFVDSGRLTREAAHWARMNFGAKGGSVTGRDRKAYRILFDERVVGTVGFTVDSRPAFMLPPGRWIDTEGKRVAADPGRRGMDRFFPGSATRNIRRELYGKDSKGQATFLGTKKVRERTGLDRKPTRGIRGREFFDAGLETLATELPLEWEKLLDKWYRDAKKSVHLPQRIEVRPRGDVLPVSYSR